MKNKILTCGYGNDKPEDFLKRLKDAGVTVVLDVRRKGSKSWCGAYRWGCGNGFGGIEQLLKPAGIKYYTWAAFGNNFDSLKAYSEWLYAERQLELRMLAAEIKQNDTESACLLCSERWSYDPPDVNTLIFTANCHRVYIAEALSELLGDEWGIEHI